ncbi:MAG: hypothetical protein ABS76_26525 [Pelagibacterium sp. SCN 64-44]|nr:MAG: hypothetical protein ABS76_26525 [Pelagibacterium sp. SCN 64-44]
MSDTISVRIDLGTARLEFAGVVIEQPIDITLDLPRQKIAEMIMGGVHPATPTTTEDPRASLVKPKAVDGHDAAPTISRSSTLR